MTYTESVPLAAKVPRGTQEGIRMEGARIVAVAQKARN
jgi:hypothetical protein